MHNNNQEIVEPQTLTTHAHLPKVLLMLFALLFSGVIFGSIGYFLGIGHQKLASQQYSTNTVSSKTAAQVSSQTTMLSSDQTEQVFTYGYPLNSSGKYKITQTVPILWRTTIKSSSDEKQKFIEFNDNLGEFQFVTNLANNTTLHGPFEPDSSLGFWDVTNWLQNDWLVSSNYDSAGIKVLPKDKKTYIDWLINLRKSQKVNVSQCPQIGIGDGNFNCYGSLNPVYIQTADKTLSGYAGISLSHQAVVYDPTVFVYMAGVLDGKTIYATGTYLIQDKLAQSFSKSTDQQVIVDAMQQIQKALPQDTHTIYNQILNSLNTIKIENIK